MLTGKALWHLDADHSELRDTPLLKANDPDTLALRSMYSMISTGTESLVCTGRVDESFAERMAVPYMEGSFSLPIKYGYSLVGACEGIHYHVMHPHQDHVRVRRTDAHALSPEIPPHRATLISNIETALNAIWDARLEPADRIAVMGFGNIGALLSMTLSEYANVVCDVVETNPSRREQAGELGWPSHAELSGEYDVILNTTSAPAAAQSALDHLALEGKLVEVSWYGSQQVPLTLGHAFHYNRLKIISSQVSHIPKHQQSMDYRKRKKLCEKLLNSDRYDALMADPIPFHHLPAWFNDLRNGRLRNGPIWIIDYTESCTR